MLLNIDKNLLLFTAILSSLRLSVCKSWHHNKDLLHNDFNMYNMNSRNDMNKPNMDTCNFLNSCLPCLLGETTYMDCSRCPVISQFVESVDILMYQNPNLSSCILVDKNSCLIYFAYNNNSDHTRVWMENGRLCPSVQRYDDHGTFLTDLVQYSPIFDVDMVCAAQTFAMIFSSVGM